MALSRADLHYMVGFGQGRLIEDPSDNRPPGQENSGIPTGRASLPPRMFPGHEKATSFAFDNAFGRKKSTNANRNGLEF